MCRRGCRHRCRCRCGCGRISPLQLSPAAAANNAEASLQPGKVAPCHRAEAESCEHDRVGQDPPHEAPDVRAAEQGDREGVRPVHRQDDPEVPERLRHPGERHEHPVVGDHLLVARARAERALERGRPPSRPQLPDVPEADAAGGPLDDEEVRGGLGRDDVAPAVDEVDLAGRPEPLVLQPVYVCTKSLYHCMMCIYNTDTLLIIIIIIRRL